MGNQPGLVSTTNCHFLSRFLTVPWEFGERQLHYVDIEKRSLGHHSSRNLFAIHGLNAKETEERLNALVETPVARFRRMSAGRSPPEEIPWDVYRALFLIVLLQIPRVVEALVGKSGLSLDDVFRHTDAELDSLVHHYKDSSQLLVLTTPNDTLFYPSSGGFFLPVKHEDSPSPLDYCFCIPLDLKLVALTAPRTSDLDYWFQFTARSGWFSWRSAAIDGLATKVVVAPQVVEQAQDEAQLVEHVLDCQRLNREILQGIGDANESLKKAMRIAGLD
jgi:hypothetical protein